nr:tetratricopeptide repeat protein [Streptomyces sp. NBC_00899]
MARQRVTRQEMNRRKLARGFVGRAEKLTMFRDNLGRNPQDEDFQYLFHVNGNAGVGKTSLVRQWETAAQAREAVTVYLDDDIHDPLEAMEAISVQMERQGLPLRAFQELLATYRQRRHEAETAPPAPGTADPAAPGPQASVTGTVLAQAGVVGLGMLPVPGAGALAGVLNPQQVAQHLDHSADRLRAKLASRLRSHDDVRLVFSPLQILTPVFLQDLGRAAERRPWLVLFFDVFERTGPLLSEWLPDVLVTEEYGALPLNVVAVLSGQGRLDTHHWGDHRRLVWEVPLDVFSQEEARDLLAAHGITDEEVIEVIVRLTGRLPVLVDLLAQTRPQDPTDVEDPADTAVDRFLKWITDPARRDAALACALPLQLNEDVYRAAAPEAAADQYTWMRGLPFVTGREGRVRYHDVVRTPMLRLQRSRSAARWQQQHLHLADTYRRWHEEREAALPPDTDRSDPDGHEHRLSEAYHRLCADPVTAWRDILPDLVDACDHGIPVLRRWAQTLAQAGHDTQYSALTRWGSRLQAAAGEDVNGTVTALTHLLAAPELPSAGRALAHALRGRDHRLAGRHSQALADYTTALDLDPDLTRAYFGRGETHRLAGSYDAALADFDRSLDLDPADAVTLASRGETYHSLQRYDAALADFDRALHLDPDNDWIIANRGETHRLAGNHDAALADFDRALHLDPTYAWAVTNRGQTYRALRRYDEALSDHHRAVQLLPDNEWVVANRGETHRLAGDYDAALADFDRAIEINPGYAWAIASRGQTYHSLRRYDAALADLDRALALNPGYPWAVASRGEIHQSLRHYDAALADFDRALDLDPGNDWVMANRGETHRLVGDYDAALADFDRAIRVDPGYTWAITNRGQTYRDMHRYEEAVSDHHRAVQLLPDNEWVVANRGETHRLAGNHDAALADFDRALQLNPGYAWAIASRGQTYRALGRHEDALADLDRALALEPEASYHCEAALLLHLLGRPGEGEHWRTARDLMAADVSAGGSSANRFQGHLMAVHCAMAQWAAAVAELDRYLAGGPGVWHIREVLEDLEEVESVLAPDPAALRPLRQRLQDAEEAEEALRSGTSG